jgi:hypothetical protein
VSIPTTTASPWPPRAAYFSAAVFIGASGATNVIYGWQKGTDLPTSFVWAGVAGAVAVIFALSWPALIRSVEARRWSAALVSLLALVLAGTYSVTAAVGSAAGGRTNAATQETAVTDVRTKAQAAYDAAKAELATLKPSRPVAELEAMRGGWRRAYPNQPWALEPELARAKRRAELEAKIERATGDLAKTRPAQVANSDAKVLARYATAIGFEVTADRLNDLLVLLTVLMIEAGGGLSLALGMALGAAPVARALMPADAPVSKRPRTPPANAVADARTTPDATPNAASVRVERTRPVSVVHPSELTYWLRLQGGRAETSMRRLADALGRSPSGVHDELRRMVASGLVTAASGPRGTVISFAAAGKPN